ncbi:MAG: methyltransferase domain-containing protein [Acidobacteria bacterium]|nr:methyltransferase domain-containing protein [Acidobacteriota bacterium]
MTAQRRTQEWNSSRYAEHARFVSDLGQSVLELLEVRAGERILDLGCGDGALTESIVLRGAQVVGVDSSPDMVQAARLRGIDARLVSAYRLPFDCEFDAVFSNAALHWMKRSPDVVIHGVRRALKPGGRFAGEMGGHGNVAAITVALCATLEGYGVKNIGSVSPWYFPTCEQYRERLESAGFAVSWLELIPRPTLLPTGMRPWLETFAIPFMKALPVDERSQFLDEVTKRLHPVLCDFRGGWTADYVRLRFLARLGE